MFFFSYLSFLSLYLTLQATSTGDNRQHTFCLKNLSYQYHWYLINIKLKVTCSFLKCKAFSQLLLISQIKCFAYKNIFSSNLLSMLQICPFIYCFPYKWMVSVVFIQCIFLPLPSQNPQKNALCDLFYFLFSCQSLLTKCKLLYRKQCCQ